MKYKVGDRVKVVDTKRSNFMLGDIIKITKTNGTSSFPYWCEGELHEEYMAEDQIAPADYTWEDFLKCPVGTKVTFERGKVIYKMEKDEFGEEFTDSSDNYSFRDLENFELKDSDYGKIIKIEEPTYTTVYEPNEVEEMTMEEVCKALGKQIKIVKEK